MFKAYLYKAEKIFFFFNVLSEKCIAASGVQSKVHDYLIDIGYTEGIGSYQDILDTGDKDAWVEIHMEMCTEVAIVIMKREGIYHE